MIKTCKYEIRSAILHAYELYLWVWVRLWRTFGSLGEVGVVFSQLGVDIQLVLAESSVVVVERYRSDTWEEGWVNTSIHSFLSSFRRSFIQTAIQTVILTFQRSGNQTYPSRCTRLWA